MGTSQISEGRGSAGLWLWKAREVEGRIRATGVQADGVPSPFTLPQTMSWWRAAESRLFLKIPGSKANTAKHCYFQCTLLSCFSNCPPLSHPSQYANQTALRPSRYGRGSAPSKRKPTFTAHPQSDKRWSPLPHLQHQPTPDSHHKSKSAVEFPSEFRHLSQELTQT